MDHGDEREALRALRRSELRSAALTVAGWLAFFGLLIYFSSGELN